MMIGRSETLVIGFRHIFKVKEGAVTKYVVGKTKVEPLNISEMSDYKIKEMYKLTDEQILEAKTAALLIKSGRI